MNTERTGRVTDFLRSVVLVLGLVVIVPWLLIAAARARFGGPSPLAGVPAPAQWSGRRAWEAATSRLSDDTIADLVVRAALLVGWAAVAVIIVTVVAEIRHVIRHGGLSLPPVRGLGLPQQAARFIAAGILAVMPLASSVSSAPRAVAHSADPFGSGSERAVSAIVLDQHVLDQHALDQHVVHRQIDDQPGIKHPVIAADAVDPGAGDNYVVRSGDSVFGIAERLAANDCDVDDVAGQILERNLGRVMADGQRFTNAAFIDVGWVLELPPNSTNLASATAGAHLVREGDTLSSIADDELGHDHRWTEIWSENAGQQMSDGQVFDDPDLIRSGWELKMPAHPEVTDVDDVAPDDLAATAPADVDTTPASGPKVDDQAPVDAAASEPALVVPAQSEVTDVDDDRDDTAVDATPPPSAGDETPASESASAAPAQSEVTDVDDAAGVATPEPAGDATPASDLPSVVPAQAVGIDVDDTAAAATTAPAAADGTPAPEPALAAADEVDVDDTAAAATTAPAATDGTPAPEPASAAADEVDVGAAPAVSDITIAATLEYPASRATATSRVPDNAIATTTTTTTQPGVPNEAAGDPRPEVEGASLLTLTRAAMLSVGVLTLLGVRRRARLRSARTRARLPEPVGRAVQTERSLRFVDFGDRFARVDIAIRSAAMALIEHEQRVVAVLADTDGAIELIASGPAALSAPWHGHAERWILDGTTPLELVTPESRRVGAPCPTLVQLGRSPDGRDVYVDLEALGILEVSGEPDAADAIVAALAATLASSTLAEVTTLIGVGVPDAVFLEHRLHTRADSDPEAFDAAAAAVGSTARASRDTFELRARATSGETWEPAVVLIAGASSAEPVLGVPDDHRGLAVVSARPVEAPTCRLVQRDEGWVLAPLGLSLTPVGLPDDDVASLAELVGGSGAALVDEDPAADRDGPVLPACDDQPDETSDEPDHAQASTDKVGPEPEITDAGLPTALAAARQSSMPWQLLVRIIGPVDVVSATGSSVSFERSKTKELVAWMATHRARSTRAAARTALWELDVRDATFANVVSEARRALARTVEPPEGDEWVGRTMTAALPLHELVRTDADLVREALDTARLEPPARAIATLRPAVELVAGLPFEGTSYLWPDAEGLTSNLVLLATSAAAELAAHSLSVGDIEGVFWATGRGLLVLPGHEELIGLRMRAHARAGDLAGVRQEWESYERVINADPWSDGEPSPKLLDLRRDLLNPSA